MVELFRSYVYLLICFQVMISITGEEVLKSLIMIALCLFLPLNLLAFALFFFLTLLLCALTLMILMSPSGKHLLAL